VHAIVQPADATAPPDIDDVILFAKARLAPYKVPKTVEFIELIRGAKAMKLSRAALWPSGRSRRRRAGVGPGARSGSDGAPGRLPAEVTGPVPA